MGSVAPEADAAAMMEGDLEAGTRDRNGGNEGGTERSGRRVVILDIKEGLQ